MGYNLSGDLMKSKTLMLTSIVLVILGLGWISTIVQAAPVEPQAAYPSPTPGSDGRIIYTVKAGDSCYKIELLYGVTDNYLRLNNQLDANCDLSAGQQLVIGMGGPSSSSPTPGPSPTPTTIQPTATAVVGGSADVCVLVYKDINGDGLRQSTEPAIPGAVVSITSLDGSFSKTLNTVINPDATAYQGMCFNAVPMGKYNVSAAAPVGFAPTINMTSVVEVTPGDTVYIDFGAQVKAASETVKATKTVSPLLGIVGAIFLLAGIGLGIYIWRIMRKK
jgi:LysM domain